MNLYASNKTVSKYKGKDHQNFKEKRTNVYNASGYHWMQLLAGRGL